MGKKIIFPKPHQYNVVLASQNSNQFFIAIQLLQG